MKKHSCENCRLHGYARRKPDSLIARIWRWHTRWCPGWKAYQRTLAESEQQTPQE
ncbi:MAG: hypothetical protein ABIG44_16065 [Planctomycetota bacterium]